MKKKNKTNSSVSMLQALKTETNYTVTENGAATLASTNSALLDLFATIGALRSAKDKEVVSRFVKAWAEDSDLAVKLLFFARDVRGGLGERRVFRTILRWMANNEPETVIKNMAYIEEYGRFDDLLVLMHTPCEQALVSLIKNQLEADLNAIHNNKNVSLMAKWLPSVNASNQNTRRKAIRLAAALHMTPAQYRKTLSQLRKSIGIIENNLRLKRYNFSYAAQPSRAMYKYRRAFLRNDYSRYAKYMNQVSKGKAKLHTDGLMPYDLVRTALKTTPSKDTRKMLDITWKALKDYTNGKNALVVMDGSGSMYSNYLNPSNPRPIDIAMSLAIYFAERNNGMFKNHFITFSEHPRLVEIMGKDLVDKVRCCESYNEIANTNIQKVFELILNAAVKNHLSQESMPETLYIISDMEFDYCTEDASLTNFEYAKKLFHANGYQLPQVVFWNVDSRNQQQPVSMNEQGTILVSGSSPRIFSMILEDACDPYSYMMSVLCSKRYEKLHA